MSRSTNNTDQLVDLLFYVLPRYIDEYNSQNRSKRHHRKREGLRDEEREGLGDEVKEEIFKRIKSLAFNDDKHNVKSEHKEGNSKKVQDNHQLHKNNTDRSIIEEKHTEDGNHKCNKFDEDKKNSDLKLSTNEKILEKETYDKSVKESYIYNDELDFKKVLKVLVNKKINIAISDPIRSIIYNVIILEISSDIVKLKTETNTVIVLCIKEIVAIQCDEKDYVNFIKNVCFNKKEGCSEGLQRYFYSVIGKKVFIQTKGTEEFRYINCKKVTAVGEGFVVIEDSIIISIRKIVLVEEIDIA